MEKRTGTKDSAIELPDSQRSDRAEDDDSLLAHNSKQLWQQQQTQHGKTPQKPSKGLSLQQSVGEQNGSASVHDHRRGFSSGKKRLHTGPLKKRSPKLSPRNSKKCVFYTPLSTPSQTLGTQSGRWSLGSIPSVSTASFRQKLTPSFASVQHRDAQQQLSVPRNLNKELMKGAMLETPSTISTSKDWKLLSNNTMSSKSKHMVSVTPIPLSFTKKRNKPVNPIVTNNSTNLPHTPNIAETQIPGRSSSGFNILRITHPFGNYPRVTTTTRKSRHEPISSPLAETTNDPTKHRTALENQLHKKNNIRTMAPDTMKSGFRLTSKIPSSVVFSPVASMPKPVSNGNKPVSITAERLGETIDSIARPDLFQEVPTTQRPCKCKKTNCLKLYCECFHRNAFCAPDLCKCQDCMNVEAHNNIGEPRGRRVMAILATLAIRPDAFDTGGRRSNAKGCRCTKSRCIKKFCECFASGNRCTKDCSCLGCKNKSKRRKRVKKGKDRS